MSNIQVAALYLFAPFPDFETHQARLKALCEAESVKGILLLAAEGVNGTIAGPADGIAAVLSALREIPGFAELTPKYSYTDENPFYRIKVRLKSEIVTLGRPEADPLVSVGTYVEPEEWNDLIQQPDVVTIDTRNDYEVQIGIFEGAINPKTESFREFPEWFDAFRAEHPDKRIAMYCTGGIRCEKATALLKAQGIEDVYHLKGGILRYLETVPERESLWSGECFVFDQRVSVGHDLAPGSYDLCHACRMPVSEEDKKSSKYEEGIACPHCYDLFTEERRERFRERQRQIRLARSRGDAHLGTTPGGRQTAK